MLLLHLSGIYWEYRHGGLSTYFPAKCSGDIKVAFKHSRNLACNVHKPVRGIENSDE